MLKVERQQESEEDQQEEITPVVVPEKRERRQSAVSETSGTGKNSASAKEEIKREAPEEPGEETEKYFSQLEFKDLPLSE
jgi:hypothetical protein